MALVKLDRMKYAVWLLWLLSFTSIAFEESKKNIFIKMGLSADAKERLGVVFEVAKTVFHWGFIPTIVYLGKNWNLHSLGITQTMTNITTKFLIRNSLFVRWNCRIQQRRRSWPPTTNLLQVNFASSGESKNINTDNYYFLLFSVCCGNKNRVALVKLRSQ